MKYPWEDREHFFTGIPVIDEQHRMMSDIINLLSIAIKKNKSRENILRLLKGYMDYGIHHRALEEELMKKNGYPDLARHVNDHHEIKIKMESLYKRISDDKMIISQGIGKFLKDWHDDHVEVQDKAMAAFLKEKGLK